MASLGERLREAREARGLSLSEVSEQIRIRTVYLIALEEENWRAIGAPVYVRGFLRTYARFLGLDPEEVVAQFGEAVPTQPASESEPQYSAQRSSGRSSAVTWIAACVAVLLVAYVAYNALTMHRQDGGATVAASTASPSAQPSQSSAGVDAASASPVPPRASASPGLGGPQSIALVLSAASWLRVVVDGNVSMEGTFPAGTSKTFHGRSASVRVGNAGGVQIYVDGKGVGSLGKSGDVVERAFVL